MEYMNVKFEAVMATPCCGKSYLCDKYPERFVDVDEVRLRCKYNVPADITRLELEQTKNRRPFTRRAKTVEYIKELFSILDEEVKRGKVLIAAPHPESYEYFESRNIKFCLVYANHDMQQELKKRMLERGNAEDVANENFEMFETYYKGNTEDTRPVVKYAFGKDEYLEGILKKFGYRFDK